MSKHDERRFAHWPERGGTAVLLPDAPAIYGEGPFRDDLDAAERRWAEAFGAPSPVKTPRAPTAPSDAAAAVDAQSVRT